MEYGEIVEADAEFAARSRLSLGPHFEDIEDGCPMIGLPSDISRTDHSVRQAFESRRCA